MFRPGQLAVHGLAILLGRNEAGISNRGKIFLHHAVQRSAKRWAQGLVNFFSAVAYHFYLDLPPAFTHYGDHLSTEPCIVWHEKRHYQQKC